MKRLASSILILATLAVGCSGSPGDHRVGAVAGAEFWTVPAGVNPADAGTPGAVGDIRQTGDSTQAFVRYGTANNQWQAFPSVVATPSSAGLISAATATSLAGLPAGTFPMVMLRSPLVDLTSATTTAIPSTAAGFVFLPSQARFVSTVKTGTASTGFTIKCGNDGSNVNTIPSAAIASSFFSASATPTYEISFVTASAPTVLADLATPISCVVTSAATGTGGFAWKGYIGFLGYLLPSS